jgi:Recombination endonuclease VII
MDKPPWGMPKAARMLVKQTGLKCACCQVVKPLDAFNRNKATANGREVYCRDCKTAKTREFRRLHPAHNAAERRNAHLRRTYGITQQEYDAWLAKQHGVCAICGQAERFAGGRDGKTMRRLAVDHDHHNGAVRGLLCSMCNYAIGALNHDPELLQAAINYLRQPRLM